MNRSDFRDHSVKLSEFSTEDLELIESINSHQGGYKIVKRILDLILFFIVLIPSVLIIVVFGILIKLDSNGPMFYKHERVGYDLKLFKAIKLRSMYNDSHIGPEFTEEEDPRITRIGKFVRRFRLDELPQIFNVLLGQMSFIGPRPLAPFEYNSSHPIFEKRTVVKPGITGLAQVKGGNDFTNLEKFKYDMEYIRTLSLVNDFKLFFETIGVIFSGKGAR